MALVAMGIAKVIQAKSEAEDSLNLYSRVKSWDKSEVSFDQALAYLNRIEESISGIALISNPFAKLKKFTLMNDQSLSPFRRAEHD